MEKTQNPNFFWNRSRIGVPSSLESSMKQILRRFESNQNKSKQMKINDVFDRFISKANSADILRGDALSNNIATADSLRSTLPLMLLLPSATDCYTSENYCNSCHKQLGPWPICLKFAFMHDFSDLLWMTRSFLNKENGTGGHPILVYTPYTDHTPLPDTNSL